MSSNAPFRALLARAASGAEALLVRVLELTRQSMLDDAKHMSVSLARDQLVLCIKLLDQHAKDLCEHYPKVIESLFLSPEVSQARFADATTQGLRLEQLEFMDEAQVQERVVIARVLQQLLMVTQDELAKLDPYVCAMQGLRQVTGLKNPLRPDNYIMALHEVLSQTTLPTHVRSIWMQHMAVSLGEGLAQLYRQLVSELKNSCASMADGQAVHMPQSVDLEITARGQEPRVVWAPQSRPTALTLARLRRLMTKELDPAVTSPHQEKTADQAQSQSKVNKESFARQFAREFEDPQDEGALTTDFDATVPAAFEALKEMQPVDQAHVMQRMAQVAANDQTGSGVLKVDLSLREQLIREAKGMAQVLSLEVVALMIDNLVQDQRLLEPVRRVIVQLEPALLRLVRVDVRFFSDKQHPARRLLQEISEQGLAFCAATDPLFTAYMDSLNRYVVPLSELASDSAQPFAAALVNLTLDWELKGIRERVSIKADDAKVALKTAEQRNLLASKIAADMRSNIELAKMPQGIVDFLLGPWAQVMATVQLTRNKADADLSGYKALVGMLLWSAQPEITSKDVDKLTQLVPRLLTGLRGGLRLIDYPSTKTSLFFDVLMKLHQQAFNQKSTNTVAPVTSPPVVLLSGDQDGWVAPAEAKVSGFVSIDDAVVQSFKAPAEGQQVSRLEPVVLQDGALAAVTEGCWVELRVTQAWSRTQLTWISPQRTMYLFTDVQGRAQSMTKRMLMRLHQAGAFRVLSEQPVVDDALDAVVHTAMVNSLDLRLE